ncbi:hypothetical protein FA15DRAFT_675908 [Coprinopsis marcescibilis]|uniref:SHSP domain-containing protein n=1 Tax=Coprinopsis marcescibilis TaxID=230819 RepID=A0A5C3KC82_COPMA|nr:hypothetical protein FA15DRAFT_675908 [Coprinopsis marcescibilis]
MPKVQKSTSLSNAATAFRSLQSPVNLHHAINRLADLKVSQAVKAGRLRVVNPPIINTSANFMPRMALVDDTNANKLTAVFELPGVKNGDISLQIQNGNLIVKGERRLPAIVQNAFAAQQAALPRNPVSAADHLSSGDMDADSPSGVKISMQEMRFGTFHRTLPIPEWVRESDVTAGLQDGMLTVTWPKNQSPSRISQSLSAANAA